MTTDETIGRRARHVGLVGAWLLVGMVGLAAPALAQRDLKDLPDPDPEVERTSFQLGDGVEVNLFAGDPLLAKPIQMNFDEQGRLWVASSEIYPQIQPGQKANDKILVIEDKDGDGKADSTKVFADGLLIPTGVAPGDGGAYVANSTELLHLADTNGDGKADKRRVMLSGFGTEDTHHIIHTFRWGPDGMLYFNQSVYIHSHIETPYGPRRLGGGGIWQFRPETRRLEVVMRGLVNPWGNQFDRWGRQFATDGAGVEGINHVIPGASYTAISNGERFLRGLNPGSPKHCGLEVLSGRHIPDDWQQSLATNDFRANRVCRFELTEDGSTFASRERPELIKTSYVAFRPIDVAMGPDGAIYVADWYNPIIQHGEVDFRDPRRDHTRGRIWRITFKGRPLVERPKLAGAPVADLLGKLKEPEDFTRLHAKRVLKERGAKQVIPALAAWTKALDPKDPNYEHHRLEALWTYQALDVPEPELLAAVLSSPEPRARAAATRVVPHWQGRISDALKLLEPLAIDESAQVRVEAVRALAQIDDPKAGPVALRALSKPVDRVLDYALWLTARETAARWLPELAQGQAVFEGDPSRLAFALEAVNTPDVVAPALTAMKAAPAAEIQDRLLALVGRLGGPKELSGVLDQALDAAGVNADQRARLLTSLADAAERRQAKPEGELARLSAALDDPAEAVRLAAMRAAGAWKLEGAREVVTKLLNADDAPESLRRAAVEALVKLGGAPSQESLDTAAKSDRPAAMRLLAAAGLAALDPESGSQRAAALLAELKDGTDPSGLVQALVQRQGGPEALAKALDGKILPKDVAKVALRLARSTGKDDSPLIDALRKAGGLGAEAAPPTPEEVQALVADVRTIGDPARGERIYRSVDLACQKCHAIAGVGGQVGPGLESIGASAQDDYLVESLLIPNKAVKEGFHAMVVATADGQVVTGIRVREDDQQLVLRDAEDRLITVAKADVEESKPSGSIMPAGLTESLTKQEFADLVRFLSSLGELGPYSLGQSRVIRRWETLEATPPAITALQRTRLDTVVDPKAPLTWKPVYAFVSGELPLEDLPAMNPFYGAPKTAFVRAQVEATAGGPVRLKVGDPAGLSIWVDGKRVDPAPSIDVDLTPGIHPITLAIDLQARKAPVRLDLEDVPGSPAQVRGVVGK